MSDDSDQPKDQAAELLAEANKDRTGMASELMGFLANNKKWWLLPIIIALLLLGVLVLLGGSGTAPFIYPLF